MPDFSGYHFEFTGIVIRGQGIGQKLNYPTANLHIENENKIIPKNGVYAVKCKLLNEIAKGVMNIGKRPTLGNNNNLSIEIHIFNFDKDIYGEELKVTVIQKIREEQKFENMSTLKNQISIDCKSAHQILQKID